MKSKLVMQQAFFLLITTILHSARSLQLEDETSASNSCKAPEMPSNGQVLCVDVHIQGLNIQYLCTYTCNNGYKFKGSTESSFSRLCSNGVFSDGSDPPQCISVCSEPVLPPFVTLTCMPGTDKLSCRAGCQPSYKLETEPEGNYMCQTGGNWFPELSSIPQCVRSHDAVLNSELPVCTAWGQDHYRTFDNSIYTFKGHCKYVLAYVPNSFSIMVDNEQTCIDDASCKRNIVIFIGDNALALKSTNNGTVVLWNNEIFHVPGSRSGTVIEKVGSYITVRSSLKFSLKWDGKQSVFIKASDELKDQINGLCGRFNGDPTDDFENEKGSVVASVVSFASSWKKTNLDAGTCADEAQTIGCPVNTLKKSTLELFADSRCSDLLSDAIFKQCHGIVDPNPYIQACKADCCEYNSSECMCETMEAYSRACLDQSIELKWRRPGRCEVHCVGGMVYKECGSSCIPDCLNLDAVCSDPTCVDGCFCPDGWVLYKEKCIESTQCPCTRGNTEYDQGSLINEECNSCSCLSGKWNCTHKDCDAVCSVMGDPHYSTFDGRRYDFMGLCSYYLVQTSDFNIIIDNIRCGTGEAACTKSLNIDFNGLIVKLEHNHQLEINGKEVTKLPYQTSTVQISMISSLFMQVVLSNGVSVMWDGHTRVYIKVPPSLKSQTLGLCGTYDGKQNNDFLTPQGSIETNPNLFGNQWKTTKDCEDMPLVIATSPCETQSQRKVQAAQLCGQLKSSLFEACHDLEAVTQYYTDCMYDLCSCTENIQDCLCPSLGTYADTCASKGVKINWRLQVKECMLQCPGGQVYQVCAKPCQHTCYAMAQNTDNSCDLKCVEGCSCPEGQSLNEDEECVPIEQCPCIFDRHEYPAGYTTLKGTDICVCTNAQWQCSRITPDNMNITKVQPLCPDNMEYSLCASDCQVTCESRESALTCDKDTICKPGCICKDGFVRDGNKCILSSMCPCYHGGQAYIDGDNFFIDCNECICKNQRWECEKNDCPSTCSAYGDSHYTTFDGRKFEFQGSCDYIMAKSAADNPNKFLITTTNLECGTTGVTCSKGIEFISGFEGTSSFYRLQFVRGKSVKPDPGSPFKMREVGEMVYVTTPFGVTILWDKGTRVYIRLSVQHINKVEGLCGNFNGDQNDDFQTRSGGLPVAKATSFGDSWRVHSTCETSKEVVNTCLLAPQRKSWAQFRCSVIASDLFEPCHALVEPKNYIERCEFDACGCDMGGDCECLCTAIAAYAHECANKGMPIRWRSKDLCGLTCDDCKEYNPCISLCPKKTCDNRYNYSTIMESCENEDLCFEGCDLHPCPEGQVYGSIVEPVTCVPEHFCITQTCEIDGKKYWEGERIYNPLVCRPECEICNCRNGEVEHITFGACFTSMTKYPPLTTATAKSTSPSISCLQSGWTGWMSASVPTYANVGDRESLAGLREKYTFCDDFQIIGIHCRVIGQSEYEKYFGQTVTCNLDSGLVCYHKDQVGGLCLDYEISYNCDCSKGESTTVRTTTTSSPSTTSVSSITRPPIKMCNWTQWMNSYKPTSYGDIESMSNLRLEYSFCAYPSSIICRTVPNDLNPQGLRYDQARQMAVTCDLNHGLVCLNSVQSSYQSCYDYEVAVKCEDGCTSDETTQSTPPVTGVRNSTSPFLSTSAPSTTGLISTASSSTYQSVSPFIHTNYTVQSSAFSTATSSTGTKLQETSNFIFSTKIFESSPITTQSSTVSYWITSVPDHTSSTSTLHQSSKIPTKKTTSDDTVTASHPTATIGQTSDYTPCPQLKMEEDKACGLLGIFDKYVVDHNQLEASSSADASFDAQNGRLMNTPSGPANGGAWMPRESDPRPHLIIDLEGLHEIAGVATQGRPDFPEWVKSYMVYFSYDGVNFVPYTACGTDKPKLFLANNDSNTVTKAFFDRKIVTRKVAIYPVEYVTAIALRVDLIRCEDIVTTSLEIETSSPASSTNYPYHTFSSVRTDTKSTRSSFSTSKHSSTVSTEGYSSSSWSTTLTPSTKDMSTSYQQSSSLSPMNTNKSSVPVAVHTSETTPRFVPTTATKCSKSHWLPLINRNTVVVARGDREELSVKELKELCEGGIVTKIKCFDSEGIPASQTGEIVECDLENGFTCSNSENKHICKDYSITYWCECEQMTYSQTMPTYSTFITETSVKPVISTNEIHTNIASTSAPTTIRDTASTTSVQATASSTSKHTSSATSVHTSSASVHATSSTTKTEPTGTVHNCISGWSSWINRNVPSLKHGEYEMMSDEEKRQFCPLGRISAIDCESDSAINSENDHSVCTVQEGLICTNSEPIPGQVLPICSDYKVKYYCECGEETTTWQQQQNSSTATQKVTVQCGWSSWLSVDRPSTGSSDSGDLETIEALKSKFGICPNMRDIECRVAGTSTSAIDAGQAGVKCDIYNGLRCYNMDITNGICYDYEVRVLCWDDVCTGSTTPSPVQTATSDYSTYIATSSTVVCPSGKEWNPCAYKCGEVCHFMGHVTGACSEKSLEICVPGCKSPSPLASSACSVDQRLLDLYSCVDTVACTCLKHDGTAAMPFESWADPNSKCSRCSCFNNEVICNSNFECITEETPPTVTQPPSSCAWSSWINIDSPGTGNGDTELISVLYSKFGLCADPIAVECRDAKTLQDVHISNQQVICTKALGLQCLNANNGGMCKDYEIRIFCPCQSQTTATGDTSSGNDLSSLFPASSSVVPSTSLHVHTNSEEVSTSSMQSTVSDASTTLTFSTLSSSIVPPSSPLLRSSSSSVPSSTISSSSPSSLSSNSSHPPVTSASSYQASNIASTTFQTGSSESSKSNDSFTTQSVIASTLSTRQNYISSTNVSPPERSSFSTNSSFFTSPGHPSTWTHESSGIVFTTHSIETVKMCGWTNWMNDHSLDLIGDMEAVSHLRKTYVFCESSAIISMKCRDVKTKKTPEELGQSNVLCDLSHGLVCINSDQPLGQCADYEVSFLCDPLSYNCIIPTTAATKETETTNLHVTIDRLQSTVSKSSADDQTAQTTVTLLNQSRTTQMTTNHRYSTGQTDVQPDTDSEASETKAHYEPLSTTDTTDKTKWVTSQTTVRHGDETTERVTSQTTPRHRDETTERVTSQTTPRHRDETTERVTSQTTPRHRDETTERVISQTTATHRDKTTERDTSQTTLRHIDDTTERDTSQITLRHRDDTTERGTSQTTLRHIDDTTERDTSQTTLRHIDDTTERDTSQITLRHIDDTTERDTSQTTLRHIDDTTERDTSQITLRHIDDTTERDTSQTTLRHIDDTTERDTSQTTLRHRDDTTERGTSQTTPRHRDETTERGTSQTTAKRRDDTTERGISQITPRHRDETTERGTSQTTAKHRDETTERGTSQTTAKHRDETTERATSQTTPRHRDETTERGTSQTTPRHRDETSERGTSQTTAKHRDETTERGTSQITPRHRDETTERGTSPTIPRHRDDTTERGTSQTTPRHRDETTERGTSQTTAKHRDETTERGTSQTTAKHRDDTTERGISQTTSKHRDETTERGTSQITPRHRDETTERATSQTTPRHRDETTERGTSQITPRHRDETTERGTSQITPRHRDETTERATSQTTAKHRDETTDKGTSQTTARHTDETSERDTSQTTATYRDKTTEGGTSQTTASHSDETTEKATSQTTAKHRDETTDKGTSQTTARHTDETTENYQTFSTKFSIPHASSTLSQSDETRIYQSTKTGTLHTSIKFDQSTIERISKSYQDSTSSIHSSAYSTTTQTTSESVSETDFTLPPKVCMNPLTNTELQFVLDSNRSASSSLSQYSGPERSRIDTKSDNLYSGAWIPQYDDNEQWISITFPSPMIVTGITSQGRYDVPEWVKTYEAYYSLDGVNFYNFLQPDGKSTLFTGNVDSDTKHTERVKPAEVYLVKIVPKTWEKRIALRFELVGCLSLSTVTQSQMMTTPQPKTCISELCKQNMGLEDKRIRDDMLTASSFRDNAHLPGNARLGGTRSWMPSVSDTSPFIQVNLMTPQLISGITTQGRADASLFVRTFMFNYSTDGILWNPYREIQGQDKIFYANWDSNTPVRQLFQRLVQAHYIRIIPQSWNNDIALRFEIHGCLTTSFSYPSNPPTRFTTTADYHENTNVYKAVAAGITDCIEWDQWLDLNHPNLTNRDEIEPIDDLIANSLHCKEPMAIDCQPEPLVRQQINSAIVSCNLWEGFKCLISDGNGPMCNNYKVRLGCVKETPECMSYSRKNSPAPLCYPDLDTRYCPNVCQQGFYCNGTHCVPKSACPCSLNGKIVVPDGIQRNENCEICQCLNGEIMCAPVSQCPTCIEGIAYRSTNSCECQCLTCKPHEFQCGDGLCIAAEKRCNCIIECIDDELECDSTTVYTPSVISLHTTEQVKNITIVSTTTSIPETSSTTREEAFKEQNCSYIHASVIENGLTVKLSVPYEAVYEVGERWSDGLCISCSCANGTSRTSLITCTKQECYPCKPGEERIQRTGLCCGECIKTGCPFGGKVFKVGEVLPVSKKCYTSTCEKSIFDNDFIIQETHIPCEDVENLPHCNPEMNITERYDVNGCCLKCLPPQNSSKLICPTCSAQLVTGSSDDTIGHFEVVLNTGVVCQNKEPVPDLKKCSGYCSSSSLYTDVLKGFQSSCNCCQPYKTVALLVQLNCSDGQNITKSFNVPETCACMPCSGGS